MNTMQQLQLAELVAEDKNLYPQFSLHYFNHRQSHNIRESIDFALKETNLHDVFQTYMKDMVE